MMDYLIQNPWLTWLLVGSAYLILEMMSGDFHIMCSTVGSFCAPLASVSTDSVVIHVIAFVIFLVLSTFLIRSIAFKYLHQDADDRLSNADALVGRKGKVTDTIEAGGYDRVKIDGDSRKAQSVDGTGINSGAVVCTLRLDFTTATAGRR